jgi:hypothetical protein
MTCARRLCKEYHFVLYFYLRLFMDTLMFDYKSTGEDLIVPTAIIQRLEDEARKEFPFDNMLMELHILRAIKAYAKTDTQKAAIEN